MCLPLNLSSRRHQYRYAEYTETVFGFHADLRSGNYYNWAHVFQIQKGNLKLCLLIHFVA